MSGYVYLLHCEGRHKIGITEDVRKRLSAIQTSNPFPVALVASSRVEDPAKFERQLHNRFAGQRVRREWFDLQPAEVEAIKAMFAEWHQPEPEQDRPILVATVIPTLPTAERPATLPASEMYDIKTRKRRKNRSMLSKEDGMGIILAYMRYTSEATMLQIGRALRMSGFQESGWFNSLIKMAELAGFCVRVTRGNGAATVDVFDVELCHRSDGRRFLVWKGKE